MSFKKNKYTVLKKAISPQLAKFMFQYFMLKRKVARKLFDEKYISQFTEEWGVWNDQQVPNTYSHYADVAMETLLTWVQPDLKPGDMLIYSGCELEHWREPFDGDDCAQVFLHYNQISKKADQNLFDKRPHLGLPSWFKG